MTQQLAQILVKEELADPAAIEEALQRQVVFGGSLDTNLLEAGGIGEAELLSALGKAFAMPVAGRSDIDNIGAHIPRLFPLVFAETYRLVPYRLLEQDFWVLQNGPPDEELFSRIRERLQLSLKPTITTEVRLHYAMHRLYGTALLPRYQSLLQRLDGALPASPKGEAKDHVLSWGMSTAPIVPTRARGDRRKTGLDLRGLLARLDAAADRDTIVEILLGATLSTFDFAGLFLVHGEVVSGWRGTTPEATQRLVRVSLPVELPSVFQTIYATLGHYLGPLPQNSVNAKLLADMGRDPPRAALLAPILVGGKLAAILFADNGSHGVSPKRVAAVLLLAQRVGLCFEQLIRRNKSNAQRLIEGERPAESPEADESWKVEAGAAPNAPVLQPLDVPTPSAPAPSPPTPDERWSTIPLEELAPDAAALEIIDDADIEELEVEVASNVLVGDESYHPFADISESPEEALDDWEDVLVEASAAVLGGESGADTRKKTAPPSVSWDDVINETKRAQDFFVPREAESFEVAGTVVNETELLFDTLDAKDADRRRSAVERLLALGNSIDDELSQRFPGRIDFDPLSANTTLVPFKRCSGITELLAARGESAAAVVLPHLESAEPTKRFFAIYFLHTVRIPTALGSLARRLYDTEPRNRYLAADALRTYARESGYAHVVQGLRDQLKVPIVESQMATVQVLGQLRDPSAVPSLIPLVVAPRYELASAAMSALAVICGQALGNDVARWAEWWQTHYNQPRAAWLVEGLRHGNPAMVRLAHSELVLLSGRYVALPADATSNQLESAVQAWEAWWGQVSRPNQSEASRAEA